VATAQSDLLYRYLFEQADVRGELVQLRDSYEQTLGKHNYPASIANLMGEALSAVSLLIATLKFEGEITFQLQGDGPLNLLVVQGRHDHSLRGVARYDSDAFLPTDISEQWGLAELLGKGHLVITITPKQGERYQGIVGIEEPSLAANIERYFAQSEQLTTRIWLFADAVNGSQPACGGMLLQKLPDSQLSEAVEFEHLEALTNTISQEELLTLDGSVVINRLYHQENTRLFDPDPICFLCGCSKEKSRQALLSLGGDELKQLAKEQEAIVIRCEYCSAEHRFSQTDVALMLEANERKH